MNTQHTTLKAQLHQILLDIEHDLQALNEWDSKPPSAEALASTQPFCVDTLSLPQWLQFIFLPRMSTLIDSGQPLPTKCGIAPIAEEYFRHYFRHNTKNGKTLIALLNQVDELLSNT